MSERKSLKGDLMKKNDVTTKIRLILVQLKVLFSSFFTNHWLNLVFAFLIISNIKILLGLLIKNPFVNDDYLWMLGSAQLNENFSDFAHLGYPPGYLMILSLTWNFATSPSAVFRLMMISNAFLSTAIIFPIYLIAKKYFSDNIALLLAIMSSLFPSTFGYSFTIMAENIFYTLTAFFIYFILQLFSTDFSFKSILWLIGSSFFFLAAVGTKLVGFCLLVPVIILVLDALIRQIIKHKIHQKIVNPSSKDVKVFIITLLVLTALIVPTVLMINNNDDLVQAVWPQEGDGYYDEMETLFSLNDTLNSSIHNFELLGRIFSGHLGYSVIALSFTGLFLALIPLLFPVSNSSTYSKPEDEEQSSTANEFQFSLASWTFFSALVVLSSFHGLYVALNPTLEELYEGEFSSIYLQDLLYGRYISVSFPFLLISAVLGFRRINQIQGKVKIIFFSILSSIFIISLFFIPFPMWSVSNNLEMSGYRIFVFLFDGLTFLVQLLFILAALFSVGWIFSHRKLPSKITHVIVTLSLLMVLLSTFSAFLIIKQRADTESVFLEPGLWLESNDPSNTSVLIRSYGGGFYQRSNEKYVIDRVTRGVKFYSNNHFQVMNFDWYLSYPSFFMRYQYVITLDQLPGSIELYFDLLMNITISKEQLDSARSYDTIIGGEESSDLFILFYILK
jgi:hypothetical protein